jgi:hypothetical protein
MGLFFDESKGLTTTGHYTWSLHTLLPGHIEYLIRVCPHVERGVLQMLRAYSLLRERVYQAVG